MFDEEFENLPWPELFDEQQYVYVVHYRSLKHDRRGVFYATTEDAALRFCIHYTTLEKFSGEMWWMLLIYRELADDIHRRETVFVAGVNQDGMPVETPPADLIETREERLRRALGYFLPEDSLHGD